MKYIEIIAAASSAETISAIAKKFKARDFRLGVISEDHMQQMRMLVSEHELQSTLDTLQNVLGAQASARVMVLNVEVSLPESERDRRDAEDSGVAAREALYEQVNKGTHLDLNFLVLVALSTVVASIGVIEGNTAVLIGAMMIAPLLGPNLALSLGTALGDITLMRKSVQTLLAGIALAVMLAAAIGFLWPLKPSDIDASLTEAGIDSVFVALASGAAAALSLTSGLSSAMVGVMVAVALLPPVVMAGITLGQGRPDLAVGAALLLAVNVVCVNLASKIVFLVKGIHPRTWLEKEKARRAMAVYVLGWFVALLLLLLVIYARRSLAI